MLDLILIILQPQFIEWFNKSILSSTVKPPQSAMNSFVSFIKSLNQDDITILLPSLSRVLKRGPELVMQAIAFTLSNLTTDLSKRNISSAYFDKTLDESAHKEIFPNLIPHIRSSNETLREEALLVIRKLIAKVSDVTVVEKILQDLLKLLKG